MSDLIKIKISPLRLPLKTNFKQASSTRNTGESIWVSAERGNVTGFGEGCPRPYVTGENIESAMRWLKPQIPMLERECVDLASLQHWVDTQVLDIDKNPAAWCGVETALLDLFAKEQKISTERMLGFSDPTLCYQYTAVLGDSDHDKYEKLIERYLKWGFTDFKVKLNGDLVLDQLKLETLSQICEESGVNLFRIRLDANNLWSGKTEAAIEHLAQLTIPFIAIEEPIEPKNPIGIQKISKLLNTSVILDESLCSETDLKAYDDLDGQFIANIKVSRVGGVLRGLKLIEDLKERHWKIIIGAHVGETSVMTRAGMCLAQAADQNLLGQEGAFGMILLEKEPLLPSLMFGAMGKLDLSKPYVMQTEAGPKRYTKGTWNYGWGLKMP